MCCTFASEPRLLQGPVSSFRRTTREKKKILTLAFVARLIARTGLSSFQTFARGSEVEVELFSFQLCFAQYLAEFFLLRGRGNGKISNLNYEIDIKIKIDKKINQTTCDASLESTINPKHSDHSYSSSKI